MPSHAAMCLFIVTAPVKPSGKKVFRDLHTCSLCATFRFDVLPLTCVPVVYTEVISECYIVIYIYVMLGARLIKAERAFRDPGGVRSLSPSSLLFLFLFYFIFFELALRRSGAQV